MNITELSGAQLRKYRAHLLAGFNLPFITLTEIAEELERRSFPTSDCQDEINERKLLNPTEPQ